MTAINGKKGTSIHALKSESKGCERGSEHWQLGGWQGFEGVDLEAVIDLKEQKPFKRLALSCVQDQNTWIFFPTEVQFWVSDIGQDFTEVGRLSPEIGQNTEGVQMQEFDILSNGKARYVKIVAKPLAPIPAWHKGTLSSRSYSVVCDACFRKNLSKSTCFEGRSAADD